MARLDAFYAFDMTNVDFSDLYYDAIQVDVFPDIFLTFDGRLIQDVISVDYLVGDVIIAALIGGSGYAAQGDLFVGGTVTLIGESLRYAGGTESLWVVDRIDLPLPLLVDAMMTVSTADDHRLIERALAGHDSLYLSAYGDRASGMAGNDLLFGLGGNDVLDGGAGDDRLFGGTGNDRLALDDGNDVLDGGAGADWVVVQAGPSVRIDLGVTTWQVTGQGRDILRGIEHVQGGAAADILLGDGTDNILLGDAGNDVLHGRAGADRLDGGFGNDVMDGGTGNDFLLGGGNNDHLIGGVGADRLSGGLGADMFVFRSLADSRAGGSDLITDFRPGTDLINLAPIDANLRIAGNQRFDFDAPGPLGIGQVTFRHAGGQTQVILDVNGDGQADGLIRLAGTLVLSEGDFIL